MHLYLWVLVALTFFVFFREDILKFYKRFEKYNLLFVSLILIAIGYSMLKYEQQVINLIVLIQYNIQHIRQILFQIFHSVVTYSELEFIFDFFFRLIILSFFIFYPYFYTKKHTKIVYGTQIFAVNVIYAFLSLIFCMFCARFGI